MAGHYYALEVTPNIPPALARLSELADNLVYAWHRETRALFFHLDEPLWRACNHNPKLFLRRVEQAKLEAAAEDPDYLEKYQHVLAWFDDYLAEARVHPFAPHGVVDAGEAETKNIEAEQIVYFCAEFGIHESLPIYSGGLGILAGDHCKAASDMNLPFIAVGLLYHQGYFTQTIDAYGQQQSHYLSHPFANLPIELMRDRDGNELQVCAPLADRSIDLRIWRARIGRISLFLLDSDVPGNDEADRHVTKRLYGGDQTTRIQQEIILGIGGVRALRLMNFAPTVWHMNEGHAAFTLIERIAELVCAGTDFNVALEQVAASTLFTTHTPVAAGHDSFDEATMIHYLGDYSRELNVNFEALFALGATPAQPDRFSMTAFALRGSRFHNGVSRIHGGVASQKESYIWPQVPAEENALTYITNGVHVESFLDRDWVELFDRHLPKWREHLDDEPYWQGVSAIDNARYWQIHQSIKRSLLRNVGERLRNQHQRNGASHALIDRSLRHIEQYQDELLIFGFARRFATYKRATLLFRDLERLAEMLNRNDQPVLIIFAGKAHPKDEPGQKLIRTIHDYALQPQFIGKVVLLEGYDMALARLLVAGCDVWLNTPEYPLEACGTSGQKAGINGVPNLSVLDGWWGEGYNGQNGWAIAPHAPGTDLEYRNHEEAADLLDIMECQVMPAYFERDGADYPPQWVDVSKQVMSTTIPRFSAERMLRQYMSRLYLAAGGQGRKLQDDKAETLTRWKRDIKECWHGVRAERVDQLPEAVSFGDSIMLNVRVMLNNLSPEDLLVECIIGGREGQLFNANQCLRLHPVGAPDAGNGSCLFSLDWTPDTCGLKHYQFRVYPYHPLLSHGFEMGCMIWV